MFSVFTRRPSAIDQLWNSGDHSSDTWSSLTGSLWDQFWGTGDYKQQQAGAFARQAYPKASEVTEQFELLYAKMPKRLPGKSILHCHFKL